MARRRMISQKIIDSDAFLSLSHEAQLLYTHLVIRGDDDGFISNPIRIMKMIDINHEFFDELIKRKFLISFASGVCLIKHWLLQNRIEPSKYHETEYLEEKQKVYVKENKVLTTRIGEGQNSRKFLTEYRLVQGRVGKDRKGKVSKGKFKKPTLEEVATYIKEKKYSVDAEHWYDYYESKGWTIGKTKEVMKDWKASVRTWERRNQDHSNNNSKQIYAA